MRRSGFTMIELIFVIVILGILASVAIPKLAATRDDAKISAAATSIGNAVSEVSSYYTAKGTFAMPNYAEMSNSLAEADWLYDSTNSDENLTIIHYRTNGNNCIGLFIAGSDVNISHDSNSNMNEAADSTTDTLCTNLRKLVIERNNSIGGSGVTY